MKKRKKTSKYKEIHNKEKTQLPISPQIQVQ